jgi:hypothetical protein
MKFRLQEYHYLFVIYLEVNEGSPTNHQRYGKLSKGIMRD